MEATSFDIWSVLILIGIAQGLFTMSVLIYKQRLSSKSSNLLLLMLVALLWIQAEFLLIRWPMDIGISLFYGTRHGSWLLLGPTLYIYIRTVFGEELNYKTLSHYAPFFLLTLIIPLLAGDFLGFRQVHYGMLTVFDNFEQEVNAIQYFYSFVFLSQFIHFLVYQVLSIRLIRTNEIEIQNNYSNFSLLNISWLKKLIISLVIVFLGASVFLYILFDKAIYRRHLDYIYVLPITFLIYIIAYKISNSPLTIKSESTTKEKYKKSSLKQDEADAYAEHLTKFLKNEKPFLNNELRLQELAESLDIPTHHLSQIINNNLNTTFFDLINWYRVEEAKNLILNMGNDRNLLEIAYDSGFNNKTSFTNAFKKYENITPSEFRKRTVKTVEA